MTTWLKILNEFIIQAQQSDDLHTAEIKKRALEVLKKKLPEGFQDLTLKVSFGQGTPADVPWIVFLAPGMMVSEGFYPVYLYYKHLKTLILAYGISETKKPVNPWPTKITNPTETIAAHLVPKNVPRYGDSFVF